MDRLADIPVAGIPASILQTCGTHEVLSRLTTSFSYTQRDGTIEMEPGTTTTMGITDSTVQATSYQTFSDENSKIDIEEIAELRDALQKEQIRAQKEQTRSNDLEDRLTKIEAMLSK